MTKLLFAVFARKTGVDSFRKSFGKQKYCYLPAYKKTERKDEKTEGENVVNENKRCKHHGVVPVVNPAGGATLVFHNPCLKRAEEENTYHVANRVAKGNQYKYAFVDDAAVKQ